MNFSESEIEIAKKLHDLDLQWQPQAGDYVYDMKGIIEKPSPFQDHVYFILDIKHFIRRAQNVEGIKKAMCWLPLWEDCREILVKLGVKWEDIFQRLQETSAFERESERTEMYRIILSRLRAF